MWWHLRSRDWVYLHEAGAIIGTRSTGEVHAGQRHVSAKNPVEALIAAASLLPRRGRADVFFCAGISPVCLVKGNPSLSENEWKAIAKVEFGGKDADESYQITLDSNWRSGARFASKIDVDLWRCLMHLKRQFVRAMPLLMCRYSQVVAKRPVRQGRYFLAERQTLSMIAWEETGVSKTVQLPMHVAAVSLSKEIDRINVAEGLIAPESCTCEWAQFGHVTEKMDAVSFASALASPYATS